LDLVCFQNPQSKIQNRRRAAFTLTELLIVIALIVLLLAMAVPAFNFISGGRSIDAGQNVVSAMLGRARARAIETERYAGVAFYLDPATGKSTMTIVVQRDGNSTATGEDPYLNYKGWTADATYQQGQEVIAIIEDGTANSPSLLPPLPTSPPKKSENRMRVQKFVSLQNNNKGHRPPNQTDPDVEPGDTWWGTASQKFVDFDIDAESETIPVGVGVQLVNDTKGATLPDRYVRTGVIMFDGRGRFDSIPYGIRQNSAWGAKIGLQTDVDAGYYSQLGVALYDLSSFKEMKNAGVDAGTENDLFATIPTYGSAPTDETYEEDWLDKNSLLLSINRYNGTLVRGE
jgi:prepilin-type N-terminal cleavage/methylation domain-containing protein